MWGEKNNTVVVVFFDLKFQTKPENAGNVVTIMQNIGDIGDIGILFRHNLAQFVQTGTDAKIGNIVLLLKCEI